MVRRLVRIRPRPPRNLRQIRQAKAPLLHGRGGAAQGSGDAKHRWKGCGGWGGADPARSQLRPNILPRRPPRRLAALPALDLRHLELLASPPVPLLRHAREPLRMRLVALPAPPLEIIGL